MKNWSLNAKFVTILGIFIFTALAISTISLMRIEQISDSLSTLVNGYAQRLIYAQDMKATIEELRNEEKVFIIETSPEAMSAAGVKIDGFEKSLRDNLDAYRKIASETGKKNVEELQGVLDTWKPISMQMRQFSLAGKNDEAMVLTRGKGREVLESFSKALDEMVNRNKENMVTADKESNLLVRNTSITVFSLAIISILVGVTLAWIVLRSINSAINRVISDLSSNSEQVASAATQIASTSQELSQSTTEQAASLQETAASVEELSSMVSKNTENAKRAQGVSGQSEISANEGNRVVGELLQAMSDIDRSNDNILAQINESNQQISDIVKVISEIGNKTRVINDIVFQTKLLSFNASVEAARAGEHGKGFAVVAEEVGNLAQMSGNAAKEISAMLDGSIQKVESIVKDTKTRVDSLVSIGKTKVAQGLDVAQQCERVLRDIAQGVSDTASMSQSISAASDEQSKGIQEINKAMIQLDRVTQMNASASEQTSTAAEQLASQSETLREVVDSLVLNIWGKTKAEERSSQARSVRDRKEKSRHDHKVTKLHSRNAKPQGAFKLTVAGHPSDLPPGVPSADDNRFDNPAA